MGFKNLSDKQLRIKTILSPATAGFSKQDVADLRQHHKDKGNKVTVGLSSDGLGNTIAPAVHVANRMLTKKELKERNKKYNID